MRRHATISALAFMLLLAVPRAQTPAPRELLDAFAVRAGTVQTLLLPPQPGETLQVDVVLDGMRRTLQMRRHDVRSADFKLLVQDRAGIHAVATPPSVTWRGVVAGQPGSAVAATVEGGQLQALVLLGQQVWGVQPVNQAFGALPQGMHLVYAAKDRTVTGIRCGNTELGHGAPPQQPGPLALREAEIAIDADYDYYQRYGSSVTQVQNQVTSVINGVDAIYQRDVTIQYKVTAVIVRTTVTYTTTDMGTLLTQFTNLWNSTQGGIKRDLAHLFTGIGTFSGVVGISYVGVVCNVGSAYGVSKAYNSNIATNVGLVCHEIGHNWNAPHCDTASPCNIMCSGLGGCSGNLSSFAPVSIATITSFKNSRTCLTDPVPNPPTIASLTPTSVTSYAPAAVTVTGTLLDTVTAVTVGGTPAASFTKIDAMTLQFIPPGPLPITTHTVQVSNAKGPSNGKPLTVVGNHPSRLEVPYGVFRGFPFAYKVHTDASWNAVLLVSTQRTPSSLNGIVNLGIGANFSDIFYVAALTADSAGLAHIDITLPQAVTPSITLYWQAITFQTPTAPLETSDVQATIVYL